MSNVIKFPKPNQQSWEGWELIGRKLLQQIGLNEAGIDWVIIDLKPRYRRLLEMTPGFTYKVEDATLLSYLNAYQENAAQAMLVGLLRGCVDLYLAQTGEPFTPNEGPGADWFNGA